ncbi:MAG: orotidine-5'-phosphate decarboxylase [Patescibacteria group bacterium]|jgi:orotidine-5'-phosphate decarboxylase
MKQLTFRQKLAERQRQTGSLVCVGLDPLLDKIPASIHRESHLNANAATDVAIWMMAIVDATAPFTAMYKPQKAHWEAIPGGAEALRLVVAYIHQRYPDIVVFEDCKRGDIGRTQEQYRTATLVIDGVDGMNFSPYMGSDCLNSLVFSEDPDAHATVSLCYTSNLPAREVQDALMQDGRPYWQFIAERVLAWSEKAGIKESAGLVMAAAYEFPKGSGQVYSQHLRQGREIVGDKLWFLIPGVGTQGGFIEETVEAAYAGDGSMVINSSSDIIFASQGDDFAEAAGERARQLYLRIRNKLVKMGLDPALVEEALINPYDPFETLKACRGYYHSPVVDNNTLGPLVGYAGTYEDGGQKKNFVGLEYYNFSQVEEKAKVLDWFGKDLAQVIINCGLECDVVIGAPMGGVRLAGDVGRHLGCRAIFAEKKFLPMAEGDKGKAKSTLVLGRHVINPGDRVVIVEDVCNNFSTSLELANLIKSQGGQPVAIVCAFNRSGLSAWECLPVINSWFIPTEQFRQDDPKVAGLIADQKIFWTAKDHWPQLLAVMDGNSK